ncbi:MAG: hypothetical protein RMK29_18830 [Myxococcales bacterium]|nr:hypothetical protein [Myxococcota bacterium]MDW8283763.1 hypothetical protein [Myxococcales bacterium]
MISSRCAVGVLLTWFAVGIPDSATAARVAAGLPSFDGQVGVELRERFHAAVVAGLVAGGLETVPPSEISERLTSEELRGCTGGPCVERVLAELKADRLLVTDIAVVGKNYTIKMRLLDQGGAEVWRATERCEICTVREAEELVRSAALRMAPWADRPGPTEQARAEKAPPPTVTPPPPPPPPPPVAPAAEPRRWTPYRYAWIVALAVGGTFVVASIPFLAYASRDGQTTCGPSVPVSDCPTVFRGNLGAGLGLLLGGGIAIGGGGFAVLYYLDHQAQRRAVQVGVQPVHRGALLGIEGRF